jgi:hypothetical protein
MNAAALPSAVPGWPWVWHSETTIWTKHWQLAHHFPVFWWLIARSLLSDGNLHVQRAVHVWNEIPKPCSIAKGGSCRQTRDNHKDGRHVRKPVYL